MSKNKQINLSDLFEFLDRDLRLVKEHEFRRAVFENGVDDEARENVWKFLFQFYPFNSTNRERAILDKEKFVEYHVMKQRWQQINDSENDGPVQLDFDVKIDMDNEKYELRNVSKQNSKFNLILENEALNIDYIKLHTILKISRLNVSKASLEGDISLIDKDIDRTGYIIELKNDQNYDVKTKESIRKALRNILITFAAFNQTLTEINKDLSVTEFNLGYTQGMNELASLFVSVFQNESEAYWCFSNFMLLDTYTTSSIALNTSEIDNSHVLKTNVAYYFSNTGMWKKLKHLNYLLSVTDSELYTKLEQHDLIDLSFCHEWLLISFKRCFSSTKQSCRCLELLASHFVELHNSALKGISVKRVYPFDLFICLSLLKQIRVDFLTKCQEKMDFFEAFSNFNKSGYFSDNFEIIIKEAEDIFDKYCIVSHAGDLSSQDEKHSNFKRYKSYLFS